MLFSNKKLLPILNFRAPYYEAVTRQVGMAIFHWAGLAKAEQAGQRANSERAWQWHDVGGAAGRRHS